MAESYKIYTLHDPDTMAVRYVGFTSKTLEKRLAGHVADSKRERNHRANWIRSLVSVGKRPAILLVEGVSLENWQERERFWILHFRSIGCSLVNSCDGGEGTPNPSPETRAKLSEANRGKIISSEQREKLRTANLGKKLTQEHRAKIGAANTGRLVSEETRTKLSVAHSGRIFSAEHRAKMRAANLGKRHTPETCAKIGAAHVGKKHTFEAIQKLRAANLGKRFTAETRSKLRAANLGKVPSQEAFRKSLEVVRRPVVEIATGKIFQSLTGASRSLGVSKSTIGRWIESGKFAYANKQMKEVIVNEG